MAGEEQFNQIFTLAVEPGIKRDGTVFEAREFSDGVWCRFQRGVPKKMGGYATTFNTFNGIPRGMSMGSVNGVNYVFSGNQTGIDVFETNQYLGFGAGPFNALFNKGYAPFTVTSQTTNTITITSTTNYTGIFAANASVVFTQSPTATIYKVQSSVYNGTTTVVTFVLTIPTGITTAYLANYVFTPSEKLLWQFDYQYSPVGASMNVLAHPGNNLYDIDNGVQTQIYIANLVPNSNNQWVFTGLADTSGTSPTNQPITASGGVCVLHPFIFVYGSNGFIANNNVSTVYANRNLSDWNGPLANQVNVASGKIVCGLPIRGGTSSPSGLFWATDSLIRVSFVNNPPTYWQYDIVASGLSVMSSRAIVEMDGIYYWLGVDRFYLYNGVVQVMPNDKNLNWLLDNINFDERQKVWATKVPKYNEIWFFYPRGTATECTDAIIYNVKDKIWYDAGQAEGARRSSGFTTQIFRTPVWAGWDFNITYSAAFTTIATPSGMTAPTSSQFYLAGDQSIRFTPGSYLKLSKNDNAAIYQVATAPYIYYNAASYTISSSTSNTITITSTTNYTSVFTAGRAVTFINSPIAPIYKVQTSVFNGTTTVVTFTTTIPSSQTTAYVRTIRNVTLVTTTAAITEPTAAGAKVYAVQGGYPIWQHETGLNKITINDESAVYSSFTTCDLSWVGGTPSQDASPGINRRMHLRRLEPDFVQSGDIYMTVLGRKFAQSPVETSPRFTIMPDTEKLDLRLEFRELRMQFESNIIDGNYEMGRTLITAEFGDERP